MNYMFTYALPLCCALVISATSFSAGYAAGDKGTGFPGRGSKVAWEKAAAVFNRGNDARRKGDVDGAIRLYRAAIEIYPDDADFHLNLALGLSKWKRDNAGAEAAIKEAVKLEPSDFRYRWQYGVILLKQSQWARAKAAFAEAKPLRKTKAEEAQLADVLVKIDGYMAGRKI